MPGTETEFKKSNNRAITRVSRPFKEFLQKEALSGILLMISVVIALVISNSILHPAYEHFWEIKFGIIAGTFTLVKPIHLWINDFLMALFFLLVGLEIKREVLIGELSSVKRALLPTIAAIGGMLVPALFYLIFNPPKSIGGHGWAIPMATDIAFALGILFLLGKRVPSSIRVFLASLAIVDDIAAVLVIAFFYSEKLAVTYLVAALFIVVLLILLNKLGVRHLAPYLVLAFILWYTILQSGLHATIAGVILAFTIPATTSINFEEFRLISNNLVNQMNNVVDKTDTDSPELEGRRLKIYQNSLQTLEDSINNVQAPLQQLEHALVPVVTFIIMPVFALANAGVVFDIPLGEIFSEPIVIGIIAGLTIGKPVGIFGFTYLAHRVGIVEKPVQLSWMQILGTGFLAGIGFTMSIFISALAFPLSLYPAGHLASIAKIGILISSFLSACFGIGILLYSSQTAS